MISYEFSGEAWNAEVRMLGTLRDYTVKLTVTDEDGQEDTIDVVLGGIRYGPGGSPEIVYRVYYSDRAAGDEQAIAYDLVTRLVVY